MRHVNEGSWQTGSAGLGYNSAMGKPSTQKTGQARQKRRWLQFSLSALLSLFTLTAIFLGAIVNRAEQQRRAVAAVQHLGGDVAFAQVGDGISGWTPEWFRSWANDEYFQPVTMISLMSVPEVRDADLTHLKGLTELQRLWLKDTKVSDGGLVHLKRLTALQDLDLSNTQVSDVGLKHLKGMSSLKRLSLLNTQVSDVGVAELRAALPSCYIEVSMRTVTVP
jgi:hypothetical protein